MQIYLNLAKFFAIFFICQCIQVLRCILLLIHFSLYVGFFISIDHAGIYYLVSLVDIILHLLCKVFTLYSNIIFYSQKDNMFLALPIFSFSFTILKEVGPLGSQPGWVTFCSNHDWTILNFWWFFFLCSYFKLNSESNLTQLSLSCIL